MSTKRIEQLIEKFEQGQTSLEEEASLRDFFQSGDVPEHLKSYRPLFQYYEQVQATDFSSGVDPFAKIDFEEGSMKTAEGINNTFIWSLRIAAGFILLLIGFSAGLLVGQREPVTNHQMAVLQQEVQQMKSVLMYGSYREASASERISAVNLSAQISESADVPDREISQILIYTMNNDENINVRQAAAEALFRFRNEPHIRKALVHSLAQQSDPLMQITLIDMLVELKEKAAINDMQRLLMDVNTREVVKTRLKAGIAELKT